MNTLDWNKVFDFVKERDPVSVQAGCLGDWFSTAATVYRHREWVKDHGAFTRSSWSTIGFKAQMLNGDVLEVCAQREMNEEDIELYEQERKRNRDAIHAMAEQIRKDNLAQSPSLGEK